MCQWYVVGVWGQKYQEEAITSPERIFPFCGCRATPLRLLLLFPASPLTAFSFGAYLLRKVIRGFKVRLFASKWIQLSRAQGLMRRKFAGRAQN
jgi:hypothetical protein